MLAAVIRSREASGLRFPETRTPSLCESCGRMREVISGKGSRFLLCELSRLDARFVKYPGQPVRQCPGHVDREPLAKP